MVTFAGLQIPHVQRVKDVQARVSHQRVIPHSSVGYVVDETSAGQTITVSGIIEEDTISDAALALEKFRVRADDIARDLDLEDGSALISCKLGTITSE